MNLYERALITAVKAHGDQKRKYTNEPYIVHPIAVAALIRKHCKNYTRSAKEHMLAVALMHDVLEDTDYTVNDMMSEYGKVITLMVLGLTDPSRPSDGIREARKNIDRIHTSNQPLHVKTIKLADLIDNTSTILQYDMDFAKVYIKEKELLMTVLKDGHSVLYNLAMNQIEEAKKILYPEDGDVK